MKAISIIGLGWLGLPLADLFIQKGYSVAGTTTNTNKQSKIANTSLTVECFNLYTDKPSDLPKDFFAESTLVLNIPPGRQNFDRIEYANRLQSLIDHAFNSKLKQLIFISTTSVFGETNKTITNDSALSPVSESAKAHAQVENYIRAKYYDKSCIVRPSGLVGPSDNKYLETKGANKQFRHPIYSIVTREKLDTGRNPVNLIHQADLLKVLAVICDTALMGHSLNVCALSHPSRKDYYLWCAEQLNLPAPAFIESEESTVAKKPKSLKLIDARDTYEVLGISPTFPSPYDMLPS